ncbi:MAG: hypothetical protein AAF734_04500, partial [Bacteroidota bacterium]
MLVKQILYLLLIATISCNSTNNEQKAKVESKPLSYPDNEWLPANVKYSEKTKRSIDSLASIFEEKYSLLIIKDGKIIF